MLQGCGRRDDKGGHLELIIEEIDGQYYADVVLTPEDLSLIQDGYMLPGELVHKRRKVYVGIRLQGEFDLYDEERFQD